MVVRTGTWLYAGNVETNVRIVRRSIRYGTGDDGDPPEFRDDRKGTYFAIEWTAPGGDEFGIGNGGRDTLEEAVSDVERRAPGVVWD